jgi:hypothetical protein
VCRRRNNDFVGRRNRHRAEVAPPDLLDGGDPVVHAALCVWLGRTSSMTTMGRRGRRRRYLALLKAVVSRKFCKIVFRAEASFGGGNSDRG